MALITLIIEPNPTRDNVRRTGPAAAAGHVGRDPVDASDSRSQLAARISANPSAPKYGLDSLRHAAASLFIEQGLGPKRVQALMGHSTIQLTFDVYSHLWSSADDDQVAFGQLQARLLVA